MGAVVSWECWDAGSIPGLAECVKFLGLLQVKLRSQLWLRSDPWPGKSMCLGQKHMLEIFCNLGIAP